MKPETQLNRLWRRYSRLFPEDLRRTMQAEMAQAIAHGDECKLGQWSGQGVDCGGHAKFLVAFCELVRCYWRCRPTPPPPRVRREMPVEEAPELYRDIGGGIRAMEVEV